MASPALERVESVREREVRDHHLLVLDDDVYEINATGREVWSLCDGARGIDAILDEMRARHRDVDPGTLQSEIEEFVGQMTELGLLRRVEPSEEPRQK